MIVTLSQLYIFLIFVVAALLLGFIIRYILAGYSGDDYLPQQWKEQLRAGLIPEGVRLMEKDYPDKVRFFNLWFQLQRIGEMNIPGELAELGVYKGETARLIRHALPGRPLHLFDSFSGFPAQDLVGETGEASTYTPNHFADTSEAEVLKNIGTSHAVSLHKGYFPATTAGLEDTRFSFINIDTDLYQPTIAGLHFFYPRLNPGGVIVIHDHNQLWPGVMRAVREFQEHIPETFIQVPDMSSSVMIIRNR